jgi:hypothetical protein
MFEKPLVLAMACLFSVIAPAQDTANANDGSKVLALESVWNQAEEKGDIKALDLILDNSMIYIDEDGSVLTKAQFLNHTAKQAGSDLQWLVTPTLSVHVYGNTAVVVGSYRVKGLRRGKPYQRDGRFVDTWAFKKGAWICVAAQATPILH